MAVFHALKIAEITRETADTVSILFEVPEDLRSTFRFTQGQHLTVRALHGGQDIHRTYSIVSAAPDGELRIAVKKIEGGIFSTLAHETLKPGDLIDVLPPSGRFFTALDPAQAKHYVAFAAGCGITPILSLLKTTLAIEPKSRFTLLYGNRTVQSILFLEELAGLKNRFMGRLEIFHFLSRDDQETALLNGRIDRAKCEEIFSALLDPSDMDEVFLCGPAGLIQDVTDALKAHGVERRKIHQERFVSAAEAAALRQRQIEAQDAQDAQNSMLASRVTLVIDGVRTDFDYAAHHGNILEAALAAGAPAPFSCRSGVCCTCRAKILEGDVAMLLNYNLGEDEVAAGYTLTCQSVPKAARVVLSFDD